MPGYPGIPSTQIVTDKLATVAPAVGNVPNYYVWMVDISTGISYGPSAKTDSGGNWSTPTAVPAGIYDTFYGAESPTGTAPPQWQAAGVKGYLVALNPPFGAGTIIGPAPSGDATGVTDQAALQAAINATPAGYKLQLQGGFYYFTNLTTAKPITIQGVGWECKQDGLLLFGSVNYQNNTYFGGTVLRCLATSGIGLACTTTESNCVNLLDFILVGPGSGTSTGLGYGNLAQAIVKGTLRIAVMNFFLGVLATNIEDNQMYLIVRGCTTGVQHVAPNNQNTYWFDIEQCVSGFVDDATCIDSTWMNPLFQGNTGTSATINAFNTTIVGGHWENAAGVRALDIFGGQTQILNARMSSPAQDGIRIATGVLGTQLLNVVAPAAGCPLIDNGLGTVIIGDTTNYTITGTGTNRVIMDPHQNFSYLPLNVRSALIAQGVAAGFGIIGWGDVGSNPAWQLYKINATAQLILRDLVNSQNIFSAFPGAGSAVAQLAMAAVLVLASSNTAGRPNAGNFGPGPIWFDTTLNSLITTDGTNGWRLVQGRLVKALTDAATVAVDCSLGDYFTLAATAGRTIGTPTNPANGMEIDFEILNNSGGAMTTTWTAAAFALAGAWVDPASTKRRTIRFRYNLGLTKWVEQARAAADI